ncbi:MAG: RNA methyltransferase [Pseudomonadota bacterium]
MRKGKPQRNRPETAPGKRKSAPPSVEAPGKHRIYGLHTVRAALENPQRSVRQLSVSPEAAALLADAIKIRQGFSGKISHIQYETRPRGELAQLVPPGAVHQGAVLACEPLAQPNLDQLLGRLAERDEAGRSVVLALDQVTDPRNVGAILRSAAAFGAAAVIAPKHHAPAESGPLAKAASGALELVPYLQAGNLGQSLRALQKAGYWSVGLAAEGQERLEALRDHQKLVLVMGAEGSGLRRLTRQQCDHLARLPTRAEFGQLNVSAAAAVALYALLGAQ